jgi:hypothetical protein
VMGAILTLMASFHDLKFSSEMLFIIAYSLRVSFMIIIPAFQI